MARVLLLIAVTLAASACAGATLDATGLEERLETDGLDGALLADPRCRPGVEGWDYVCTFRVGRQIGREKAAFLVGREEIEKSTGVLALDLPLGPAPGSRDAERWTSFVSEANAVCGLRRKRIAELAASTARGRLVARLARAARIQNAELSQLQRLARPPGRERARRFSELLGVESELLSANTRFRRAVVRRDADAARREAGDVEVASRRIDRLARSLGLTRCGQTH